MRYQHLKIVRRISRYVVPIAPVLLAVLLVLNYDTMPRFVRTATHRIAEPIWAIQSNVLNGARIIRGLDAASLETENEALREEVERLRRITYVTRSIANDNAHLRSLLERRVDESYQIAASVIHGTTYSPYDTFIIDQGAQQGVRDGMLVLGGEYVAVGYVQTTLEHTATVRLFSASDLSLNAVLHTSSSSVQHVNIFGLGGGSMQAIVPRDVAVEVGDEVALSSFQTYVLGQVVEIENTPEDAFKKLYIKNPINTYELRYALVDTVSVFKGSNVSTDSIEATLPQEEE